METLNQLLKDISPEVKEVVMDKLANLEDDDLVCLGNTFMPFPCSERKASHPNNDDWFILPKYLSHLEHSKEPVGEGLRMIVWQKLVFAEAKSRGLGEAEFWTKDQIAEDRSEFVALTIKGRAHEEFYDANLDDDGDEEFYNPKGNPERTVEEVIPSLLEELEEKFFQRRE